MVLNVPPIAGVPLFLPPFTPANESAAAQVRVCLLCTACTYVSCTGLIFYITGKVYITLLLHALYMSMCNWLKSCCCKSASCLSDAEHWFYSNMLSDVMHECLQLQFMPTDQHECKCNILAKHRKLCVNTVLLEPLPRFSCCKLKPLVFIFVV